MIILFLVILVAIAVGLHVFTARHMKRLSQQENARLASLPAHYGWCAVMWILPACILLAAFGYYEGYPTIILLCLLCVTAMIGVTGVTRWLVPKFSAHRHLDNWIRYALAGCAVISVMITVAILGSVLFESLRFFEKVPFFDFLFGLHWSPQTALRADQAGSSGSFGFIPLLAGTLMITLIAMIIAVPVGVMAAVYLSEYIPSSTRDKIKPALEVLAGIPTVVYGYFAVLTVAPALRSWGDVLGLDIASESALGAGIVMGIMIIPYILSLSEDVITAVPASLKDAALGVGSTESEAIMKVILPAAFPGILSAVLLAVSRAIGETMIVVMAAGLTARLSANPLDAVTTVTVQMMTLLVGDQEFDSAKTLAAFALGLTLFVMTLTLNLVALRMIRRYQKRYQM